LEAPPTVVDKKVYYVGDPPIPLIDWVNGFAVGITGKPVRTIPAPLLKIVAATGTLLNGVGVRFPITLSRYRSMTEDYFSPVQKTIEALGASPYTLEEGIKETVAWLDLYWNGKLS
jgi:nucleoside-diphosphate-sugar epimerase